MCKEFCWNKMNFLKNINKMKDSISNEINMHSDNAYVERKINAKHDISSRISKKTLKCYLKTIQYH